MFYQLTQNCSEKCDGIKQKKLDVEIVNFDKKLNKKEAFQSAVLISVTSSSTFLLHRSRQLLWNRVVISDMSVSDVCNIYYCVTIDLQT